MAQKNQLLKATLIFFVAAASSIASAQVGMEASLSCDPEYCAPSSDAFASDSPNRSLLHRINLVAADGKDPRGSEAWTGIMGAIGTIEPNQAVPVSNDGLQSGFMTSTAFMVSPCHVLTNYHAVYGKDYSPQDNQNHDVTFKLASGPVAGKVVAAGDFKPNGDNDWALVKLAECVGKQVGWFDLGVVQLGGLVNMPVSMAGFPDDRDRSSITVQDSCKVRGANKETEIIAHDCGAREGSSGSPIFRMTANGPQAVSIHAGSLKETPGVLRTWDVSRANVGISIAEIVRDQRVQDALLKDLTGAGANPLKGARRSSGRAI